MDSELVKATYKDFELWQSAARASQKYPRDAYQYGYLLTNQHVIRAAAQADAQLADGRRGWVFEVILEAEDLDLALVNCMIPGASGPNATLRVAGGPQPSIGEKVYAIGSPKGLESSLSEGIISGVREVSPGIRWLQTTAPVSPGSSGGPLLKPDGQVVGVVTALTRGGQNLNFAVPASHIVEFLSRPCNTRKIGSGTSICEEEGHAYIHALAESDAAQRIKKGGFDFGKVLSTANSKIKSGDDAAAFKTLADVASGKFGEFEYLFHHTLGRIAIARMVREESGRPKSQTLREFRQWYSDNRSHQLAIKSFLKAIELKSDFAPSHEQLVDCLAREGRFDEAFTVADLLVKLVPRCSKVYRLRGGFHTELGRHLAAYEDFKKAAELGPQDPERYWEIALVCGNLGENAEAIDAYETAIRLKSRKSGMCYYNMGMAYTRLLRYEKALTCFEEAKSLGFPSRWCDEKITECRARVK